MEKLSVDRAVNAASILSRGFSESRRHIWRRQRSRKGALWDVTKKKKDFLRTGPKCPLCAVSRTHHAREPISCLLFTFLRRPSRRGGGSSGPPGGPSWKWPVTPICTEPPPLTRPLRHVGVKGRVRGTKQQAAARGQLFAVFEGISLAP